MAALRDFTFYEFFAGGGMARAGLGLGWRCLFANDLSTKKAESYQANFGGEDLFVGDVHDVTPEMLPGRADLAWGSFPCQDLSLAGVRAGLSGGRSSAFFGYMDVIAGLRREGRAPRALALENVCGALTSRGRRDFSAIGAALSEAGYRFGALVIDASLFLPQSRPRLFIIALDRDVEPPRSLVSPEPVDPFSPRALIVARNALDPSASRDWLWWRLPAPRANAPALAEIVERDPKDVAWKSDAETAAVVALMSPLQRARLEALARSGKAHVGALYRRIRPNGEGGKVQRAEARFDGRAGCLRTPGGGSSRQFLVEVEAGRVRMRLMSAREAARLMGLPDDYILPARYNDAYRLAGDGVAVPVVRWLAGALIEPLLSGEAAERLAG